MITTQVSTTSPLSARPASFVDYARAFEGAARYVITMDRVMNKRPTLSKEFRIATSMPILVPNLMFAISEAGIDIEHLLSGDVFVESLALRTLSLKLREHGQPLSYPLLGVASLDDSDAFVMLSKVVVEVMHIFQFMDCHRTAVESILHSHGMTLFQIMTVTVQWAIWRLNLRQQLFDYGAQNPFGEDRAYPQVLEKLEPLLRMHISIEVDKPC